MACETSRKLFCQFIQTILQKFLTNTQKAGWHIPTEQEDFQCCVSVIMSQTQEFEYNAPHMSMLFTHPSNIASAEAQQMSSYILM